MTTKADYEKNKERYQKYAREYYHKNKEAVNLSTYLWRDRNMEKYLAYQKRYYHEVVKRKKENV
jgi:hypothetical protein